MQSMYVCLNTFVYVYACTWVGGLVVVRFRVSVRVSMKPVMFIPIYPDVYTHYIAHRPSIKGTKLLLTVIKAIIIIY